jgi:hypothetical protein
MAGLGISKMSAGSRTTVGGYGEAEPTTEGQFQVSDKRRAGDLRNAAEPGLEPVFKNWDSAFRTLRPRAWVMVRSLSRHDRPGRRLRGVRGGGGSMRRTLSPAPMKGAPPVPFSKPPCAYEKLPSAAIPCSSSTTM